MQQEHSKEAHIPIENQAASEINFHASNLQVTNKYYEKYEAVSTMIDENPNC
jgi:hypothetical protein